MEKLSAVIITKNEEKNIERCLKSISWVDEIMLLDNGSQDQTLEICKKFGCKIITSNFLGFGRTKKLIVDTASNNWILSIDADEEVSEQLRKRIETILQSPVNSGYRIKRRSYFLGKLIQHSGWQRDYTLRLFDRRQGNFNTKRVHESVQIVGKIGHIEEPLYHYTYPTLSSHLQKMDLYTTLAAETAKENGKTASIFGAMARGWAKFIKMYILMSGFRDGKKGLILAINSAFGVYLKYLKLWEIQQQ